MQFFSNKIGCMHLPQQNIQPIYMLFNSYILAFYRCLCHFDITLTINHLTFLCKPTVSECLFNVYLIEGLNLQGRLGP